MTTSRQVAPDSPEEDEEEQPGCCRSLFCCIPVSRRRRPSSGPLENGQDYDYIVEKLLVKRLSVAILRIAGQDQPTGQASTSKPTIGSPGSTGTENRPKSNSTKIDSLEPVTTSATENVCMSARYEEYVKQQIKGMELLDSLTAYNPDLKDRERPPKIAGSLERKGNSGIFGSDRSKETVKQDVGEPGGRPVPETWRKLIVSPVQVDYAPRGTIDLAESRNYPDCPGEERDEDGSTVLRWRITIKHPDPESGSNRRTDRRFTNDTT